MSDISLQTEELRQLRYELKATNKILLRMAMALDKWIEPLSEIREFECGKDCDCKEE